MSQRVNNSRQTSNTNKSPILIRPNVGIVVDVILTDEHSRIQKSASDLFSTGKDTTIIGNAVIRPLGDEISAEADLIDYPPLDSLNMDVPLIGETVELVKIGNSTYYRRITRGLLNTGNAQENFNKNVFELTEPDTNVASSYSKTSQTGTSGTSGTDDRDTSLGEVFEPNQVNRLKLYEADKLVQSRFGQSLRFSGYNNPDGKFAPTIILRNRQNDFVKEFEQKKVGDIIEEDINRDGSIIVLSSKEHQLDFQPGTVDDGGTSDFETKIKVFEKYPKKLKDNDQMLLSSGRIIFSSKNAEMIFYSKGNYGFISDGKFSIDNGKGGADLDFGDNVNITTDRNSGNVSIVTGTGEIRLNTDEQGNSPARTGPPGPDGRGTLRKEPMVRGEVLIEILQELIDEINAQIFATPSGPTSTGPENRGNFSKIKSKLDTIKSTLNFTE